MAISQNLTSIGGRQSGAALGVAMIMLLVLTLLGVSAMQVTRMQERMAGNVKERNEVFQMMEAAIRDVEACLRDAQGGQSVTCAGGSSSVGGGALSFSDWFVGSEEDNKTDQSTGLHRNDCSGAGIFNRSSAFQWASDEVTLSVPDGAGGTKDVTFDYEYIVHELTTDEKRQIAACGFVAEEEQRGVGYGGRAPRYLISVRAKDAPGGAQAFLQTAYYFERS